jgi:hypothetical protein
MKSYGTDAYSRYVEVDGERYQVEPWPFPMRFDLETLATMPNRIRARIDVMKWHVAMLLERLGRHHHNTVRYM